MYREKILDLYNDGIGQRQIAREVRVSRSYVQKVIKRYDEANTSQRAQRCKYTNPKVDENTLEYIEVQKLMKPSIYGSEIKQRLLLDGVVHPGNLPSISQINKVIHEKLVMSHKKITAIPLESNTAQVIQKTDDYLTEIAHIDTAKLHFFDESSVIKTTGNRKYGSSRIGEAAFEMQRYASDANYTINLLHSLNGVDYFNILDGPSNGIELLTFFDEALALERADGSAVLEHGDCVVMDNCGFHHGR